MVKRSRRLYRRKRKTRRAQRGGGAIPNVCFQTSPKPIEPYIVERLKQYLHGWTYEHYDDAAILDFFQKEGTEAYPAEALTDKFNSFMHGEHKADLFRYFYLFVKGGVFIDSDLLIYTDLSRIVGDNEFVSVRALQPEGSVFNGFLAAIPNHPIIKAALDDIMKVTPETLASEYHHIVANLGTIVDQNKGNKVKLLKEINNTNASCDIVDDSGDVVMVHYQNMAPPKFPIQRPTPKSS